MRKLLVAHETESTWEAGLLFLTTRRRTLIKAPQTRFTLWQCRDMPKAYNALVGLPVACVWGYLSNIAIYRSSSLTS